MNTARYPWMLLFSFEDPMMVQRVNTITHESVQAHSSSMATANPSGLLFEYRPLLPSLWEHRWPDEFAIYAKDEAHAKVALEQAKEKLAHASGDYSIHLWEGTQRVEIVWSLEERNQGIRQDLLRFIEDNGFSLVQNGPDYPYHAIIFDTGNLLRPPSQEQAMSDILNNEAYPKYGRIVSHNVREKTGSKDLVAACWSPAIAMEDRLAKSASTMTPKKKKLL